MPTAGWKHLSITPSNMGITIIESYQIITLPKFNCYVFLAGHTDLECGLAMGSNEAWANCLGSQEAQQARNLSLQAARTAQHRLHSIAQHAQP